MFYLTSDDIIQQCVASFPGYRQDKYGALTRSWIWSALRALQTDRIGVDATAEVRIEKGFGQLPSDFLGEGILLNVSPLHYKIQQFAGTVQSRCDGCYCLKYKSIPVDEYGVPLILEMLQDAVIAYIDWKFTELWQRERNIENPAIRIDMLLNRENQANAYRLLGEAKGELNMLTAEEVLQLREFIQNRLVYRNRYHG